MRIYKREDTGKWCFDLHLDGRRIRRTTYNTKAEARKAAQDIIENGEGVNVSFQKFYLNWYSVHKEKFISKSAQNRYVNSLNQFIKYFGEHKQLNKVTRTEYQSFINHYAETHAKETVRKLHNCLRAAFTGAEYEKLIRTNPTFKITLSGNDDDDEKVKFMYEQDFIDTQKITRKHLTKSHLIIYILSITGGRFSEVNKLTRKDLIDDTTIYLHGLKTKTSKRYVKISKEDMDFIKESLEKLNITGEKLFGLSNNAVNKAFKKIQTHLNVEEEVTLHALRHTHVSYLFNRDVDIRYISKRLGHADVSITLKIYTHLLKEHKQVEESKTEDILARNWHGVIKETSIPYVA